LFGITPKSRSLLLIFITFYFRRHLIVTPLEHLILGGSALRFGVLPPRLSQFLEIPFSVEDVLVSVVQLWPSRSVGRIRRCGGRDADNVAATGGGLLGAAPATSRDDYDAVVSLCRMGTADANIPTEDHARFWLIDSARAAGNAHLKFALQDAADAVASFRAEGKRVLLHCVPDGKPDADRRSSLRGEGPGHLGSRGARRGAEGAARGTAESGVHGSAAGVTA
jgi:hypothetical protein